MEREPRAALILNRFTRSLRIMYATDAVEQILGLRPDQLLNKSFYECILLTSLDEAVKCLESAKANESIAYLRFSFKDPRIDLNSPENEEVEDQDEEEDDGSVDDDRSDSGMEGSGRKFGADSNAMDVDDVTPIEIKEEDDEDEKNGSRSRTGSSCPSTTTASSAAVQSARTFELEAVVSCTSDGLVVVLRKARPPIPDLQPVVPSAFNYENGLFAAPWGQQPIEPYISPELLYTFRPPFLPQYMPLRESVKAAGGPPLEREYRYPCQHPNAKSKTDGGTELMRSIRDVAVFAWALSGINGNMATYGHGRPRIGAQPADGLPVWEPSNGAGPSSYRGNGKAAMEIDDDNFPRSAYAHNVRATAAHHESFTRHQAYERTRHSSLDEGMYENPQRRQMQWSQLSAAPYDYGNGNEARHSPHHPLRSAASHDALQDYGHGRQQQQGYYHPAPHVMPPRTCAPGYGVPGTRPPNRGESSQSSRYFWQ